MDKFKTRVKNEQIYNDFVRTVQVHNQITGQEHEHKFSDQCRLCVLLNWNKE